MSSKFEAVSLDLLNELGFVFHLHHLSAVVLVEHTGSSTQGILFIFKIVLLEVTN